MKAPFLIDRVRQNKNGLHIRILAVWGSGVRVVAAAVIGRQIPKYWNHMPAVRKPNLSSE